MHYTVKKLVISCLDGVYTFVIRMVYDRPIGTSIRCSITSLQQTEVAYNRCIPMIILCYKTKLIVFLHKLPYTSHFSQC